MKKILNNLVYIVLLAVSKAFTKAFFGVQAEGAKNIPPKGPFIIASNHASFLDPVVIQTVFPLKISWIAKKGVYEKRYLKLIHWVLDSIPVNGAVDKAVRALEEGRVLGIFPEGIRSADGRLKKADTGAALLALKSGAPVVPVAVKGSFEAFPPGKKFFRRHPITVKIGSPLFFKKEDKAVIEEPLLIGTKDHIMKMIKDLFES